MEVMHGFVRILLALALALAFVASPALAQQPTKDQIAQARTHYTQGVELYEDGDYDAALVEFQRAYDTAPAFKILYNIGLVQRQLNDYAGSLRSFKKFLEDGGKKIDAKRRNEVEREIAKLQGRVAKVTVKSNVEGAAVLVDDDEVGETPLMEPVLVNAGRRTFKLTKSGHAPVSRVLKVAGGDEKDVQLDMKAEGEPSATAPPSQPEKPTEPTGPTPPSEPQAEESGFPWLPWAITGVLAAGTVVAGVMTLSAQSDLKSERESVTSREKLDDAEDKTRTLALVTDVLLIGTAVAAGVSLYITLGSDSSDPKQEKARARPLQVGVGAGSVELRGSF